VTSPPNGRPEGTRPVRGGRCFSAWLSGGVEGVEDPGGGCGGAACEGRTPAPEQWDRKEGRPGPERRGGAGSGPELQGTAQAPSPGSVTHRPQRTAARGSFAPRGLGDPSSPVRLVAVAARHPACRNRPIYCFSGSVCWVLRTARSGGTPASLGAASTIAEWPDAHPAQGEREDKYARRRGDGQSARRTVFSPLSIYTDLGPRNGTLYCRFGNNLTIGRGVMGFWRPGGAGWGVDGGSPSPPVLLSSPTPARRRKSAPTTRGSPHPV
jgi:hypothetical protein